MKIRLLLLLCCVFLVSCKTKINQYVKDDHDTDKRNGKWREEYSSNEGVLIATGKYKKGEKIGVWKMFSNDKLFQKDKIRRDITKTKNIFPTEKLWKKARANLRFRKMNAIGFILATGNFIMIEENFYTSRNILTVMKQTVFLSKNR
jgi:hypothetical protein